MKKLHLITRFALLASLGFAGVCQAQSGSGSGWHFLLEPYAMFPNMQGKTGVRNIPPVDVDENPSDIFQNLQAGAMLYAEAHNDRWAVSSDVLWMKLEADVSTGNVINSGSTTAEQLGWELAVLARLSPWMELGIAATYNDIEAKVDLNVNVPLGTAPLGGKTSESWVDPSVVMRAQTDLNEKWFLSGRGNIGGFGVGSDLFWQIQADAGYRISERMLFTFGYRVISVDYDHGSGSDRFIYDMKTFGPVLKFGFTF